MTPIATEAPGGEQDESLHLVLQHVLNIHDSNVCALLEMQGIHSYLEFMVLEDEDLAAREGLSRIIMKKLSALAFFAKINAKFPQLDANIVEIMADLRVRGGLQFHATVSPSNNGSPASPMNLSRDSTGSFSSTEITTVKEQKLQH